jgi:parallel beta-helix repeat protein
MKKIIFSFVLLILISGCVMEAETKDVSKESPEGKIEGLEEVILPEHCSDGVYNNGEEGLDCGWSCPNSCTFVEKSGVLTQDEIWEGNILVTETVEVAEGKTLVIKPGTIVKFKHWLPIENGKHTCGEERQRSLVIRGTLKAEGTPNDQIWFTSDSDSPINGEWFGISFKDTKSPENVIDYAIVEYGTQNINFWNSYARVSNTIVRWDNWEGIYLEYHSNPLIENCLIYENAYLGIAMEQINEPVIRNNIINQTVFSDFSNPIIENNIIERFQASSESVPILKHNTIKEDLLFIDISSLDQHDVEVDNNPSIENDLVFDYEDLKNFELGYVPGDPVKDVYPYIYPTEDDTRKVISKHLKNFTDILWTLDYDGKYFWASIDNEVVKLDPDTLQVIDRFGTPSTWLRGMASDGTSIWVNGYDDYVYYEINPATRNVVSSFSVADIPGVPKSTLDVVGDFIYIIVGLEGMFYKLSHDGRILDEVTLKFGGGWGLTHDGQYFYTCCGDKICKFDEGGNLKGQIYAGSETCWDVTWRDGNLWTAERTNENWMDEKIYEIEIKNDQLLLWGCPQ